MSAPASPPTGRAAMAEALWIAVMALIAGIVLGALYGWAGTWMMLGSVSERGPILPLVPPLLVVGLGIAAAVVAIVAGVPAARRASAIAPLAAVADRSGSAVLR